MLDNRSKPAPLENRASLSRRGLVHRSCSTGAQGTVCDTPENEHESEIEVKKLSEKMPRKLTKGS